MVTEADIGDMDFIWFLFLLFEYNLVNDYTLNTVMGRKAFFFKFAWTFFVSSLYNS